MLFYVYVLKSIKDGKYYIGYTGNLRKRLEEHKMGKSKSTKHRGEFELISYEACKDELDAKFGAPKLKVWGKKLREKYMKTTPGLQYLAKRLRNFNLRNNS